MHDTAHPTFLRNAWYVAAWDRDIGRKLLSIRILGESVVLFRSIAGQPVALADACAHRRLPLSMGRLQEDDVECGYHGLLFVARGRCKRVPGADRVPSGLCVQSYSVVSRFGLVWIWMGEQAKADPTKIFPVEHWDDSDWGRNDGDSMHIGCNYLYCTDNLLDPSHVAWVHQGSFGTEECEDVPMQTCASDDGIVVSRWVLNAELAPFYAPFVNFRGLSDRLQHYEVRYPSHAIIKAVLSPAGKGGAGTSPTAHSMLMHSYNFLTPIDGSNTRYFWFQMRNFAPLDEAVSRLLDDQIRKVFCEDKVILEAVEQGFVERPKGHIDLGIDRGPLQFRRRLKSLIAAEDLPGRDTLQTA